ncbi:MAG: HemK family protein methyltransferase [Candidatus Paceibacterota bacterium]
MDFLGTKIDLSLNPLVPREETEYWVALILKEIKEGSKCLDLFSGSGCIGVSILKNVKDVCVHFGEIEERFIQQIKINLKGFSNYKVIKTDVFSNIKGTYDYILANPPYVAEERINEVALDVLENEPHIALFSGKKGLDAISKLINSAVDYLNKDGLLVIEHDELQKEEIKNLILKNNYSRFSFLKDQFGKYRFVKIYK